MSSTYDRIKPFFENESEPKADTLLTQEEWDVYSLLSIAYNAFVKLPVVFPGDQAEFAFGINQLKNIVMSRPVARELTYEPNPVDNIEAATRGGSKGESNPA